MSDNKTEKKLNWLVENGTAEESAAASKVLRNLELIDDMKPRADVNTAALRKTLSIMEAAGHPEEILDTIRQQIASASTGDVNVNEALDLLVQGIEAMGKPIANGIYVSLSKNAGDWLYKFFGKEKGKYKDANLD